MSVTELIFILVVSSYDASVNVASACKNIPEIFPHEWCGVANQATTLNGGIHHLTCILSGPAGGLGENFGHTLIWFGTIWELCL